MFYLFRTRYTRFCFETEVGTCWKSPRPPGRLVASLGSPAGAGAVVDSDRTPGRHGVIMDPVPPQAQGRPLRAIAKAFTVDAKAAIDRIVVGHGEIGGFLGAVVSEVATAIDALELRLDDLVKTGNER